jgi:hypothetical protein
MEKVLFSHSNGSKEIFANRKSSEQEIPRWMNKAVKVARNSKSNMWIKYRNSSEYKDLVE